MKNMLDYIKLQPATLQQIASGAFLSQLDATVSPLLAGKNSTSLRVIMVASGTSYNAMQVAASAFACPVELHTPYDFYSYQDLSRYDENCLFIFVSQGGESKVTLDALNKVRGRFTTLTLTLHADSPIGRAADACLPFGCEDEQVIVRTLGFSSSALMLISLGHYLAGNPKQLSQRYALEVLQLNHFIAQSLDFFSPHVAAMSQGDCWVYSASGQNSVIAQEATLKTLETIQIPAISFDIEELVHGPQCIISNQTQIVIIEDPYDPQDKAFKLFKALRMIGKQAYLIAVQPRHEWQGYILVRPLLAVDALTTVIPLQILSYLVSRALGIDINQFGLPALKKTLQQISC